MTTQTTRNKKPTLKQEYHTVEVEYIPERDTLVLHEIALEHARFGNDVLWRVEPDKPYILAINTDKKYPYGKIRYENVKNCKNALLEGKKVDIGEISNAESLDNLLSICLEVKR